MYFSFLSLSDLHLSLSGMDGDACMNLYGFFKMYTFIKHEITLDSWIQRFLYLHFLCQRCQILYNEVKLKVTCQSSSNMNILHFSNINRCL